jgi:tetratricopeptide (TPR) repeat protein
METRRLAGGLSLLLCGGLSACAHMSKMFKPSDPLTAAQHFRLGAAFEADNRPNDAARQYTAAIRGNSVDPEAWVALGNLNFKRGDLRRAEDDYLRALNISPSHVGAENNLALVCLARNELGAAERLAKEALRKSGRLKPYVLDTLAAIYQREGRQAEARAAADQAAAAALSEGITLPPAADIVAERRP